MTKIDRDLILLPNDRYEVVALISIFFEFLMGCPDLEFQVKVENFKILGEKSGNGEKSRKFFKKLRKGYLITFLSLQYTFWPSFVKK